MVLLDLLHIQRAGFFKFLKSGLNEELSQLNINIENTRLEILPFADSKSFTAKQLSFTKTYKGATTIKQTASTSQITTPYPSITYSNSMLQRCKDLGLPSVLPEVIAEDLQAKPSVQRILPKDLKLCSPSVLSPKAIQRQLPKDLKLTVLSPKAIPRRIKFKFPPLSVPEKHRGVASSTYSPWTAHPLNRELTLKGYGTHHTPLSKFSYAPGENPSQKKIKDRWSLVDDSFLKERGAALLKSHTVNKNKFSPSIILSSENRLKDLQIKPSVQKISKLYIYPTDTSTSGDRLWQKHKVAKACLKQNLLRKSFPKKAVSLIDNSLIPSLSDPKDLKSGRSPTFAPNLFCFAPEYHRITEGNNARISSPHLGKEKEKFINLPIALPEKEQVEKITDNLNRRFTTSSEAKNACFCLIAPKYTPREAILYQKSWSCKLVVRVLLTVHTESKAQKLEQQVGDNKLTHTSIPLKGYGQAETKGPRGSKKPKDLQVKRSRFRMKGGQEEKKEGKIFESELPIEGDSKNNKTKIKLLSSSITKDKSSKDLPNRNVSPVYYKAFGESVLGQSSSPLKNLQAKPLVQRILPKGLKLRSPTVHQRRIPTVLSFFCQRQSKGDPKAIRRRFKLRVTGKLQKIPKEKGLKKSLSPVSKPLVSSPQQNGHELFLVLGELPLMTKRGHFIINGSPRVILSQLIRTPGIYFTDRDNELQADCVPEQGPWLCISKNLRDTSSHSVVGSAAGSKANSQSLPDSSYSYPYPDSKKVEGVLSVSVPLSPMPKATDYQRLLTPLPLYPKGVIVEGERGTGYRDMVKEDNGFAKQIGREAQTKSLSSYFCYTKQFSSMPFSLIYSNFRTFELHSQFTDQTLLLTKLRTLEKIRQLRELITTLLTFTWKKRTRKRLQKLYTKRCFTATQQFEKTKIIFRLKRKLILGSLGRKSFNEKLGVSNGEITFSNPSVQAKNIIDLGYFDQGRVNHKKSFGLLQFASLRSENLEFPVLKTKNLGLPSVLPEVIAENLQAKPSVQRILPKVSSYGGLIRLVTDTEGKLKDKPPEKSVLPTDLSLYPFLPDSSYSYSYSKGVEGVLPVSFIDTPRTEGSEYQRYLGVRARSKNNFLLSPNVLSEGDLLSQDLSLIVRFLDSHKIMPKDDIDDLNNQRVRTSSDQVQQQVRVGCLRFRKMFIKLVRESWGVSQTITDLLNGALREFFGSNPLSQFLDQTNSLAEITHKRRISKLGLGGIQRESATLKVRTIHSTYFGRICPIETPEGVNAGLVNSLTCLSRVNEQGQLVTPLSPLMEKQLQNQFFYYSNQETQPLSTTDTALLKFQRLPNQFIYTKNESHFQQLEVNKVHLRVQSDLQTISLATALIPFLPYDDANRALMGSNMQRQAVPLILPERPMIRTGLESLVISESGHSKESPTGGFVSYVSAQFVIIICHVLNKRALSF